MRTSIIRAYALGIITGGFLTAGIMFAAGPAKADPSDIPPSIVKTAVEDQPWICRNLSDDPSVSNLTSILYAIGHVEHLSGYDSGEVVALAVSDGCAQFVPVLQRFAAIYTTSSTAVA